MPKSEYVTGPRKKAPLYKHGDQRAGAPVRASAVKSGFKARSGQTAKYKK